MYRIVTYEMNPNSTGKFIKLKYNFEGSIIIKQYQWIPSCCAYLTVLFKQLFLFDFGDRSWS
jgi:hypothetical protein